MAQHQPTLKDIAENLQLSIGTVQRALNNKGGYTPQTQQRILEEASRIGYKVNPAASMLSRIPVTVAAIFPEPTGHNRFYYRYVWQGLEKAASELSLYKVELKTYYVNMHTASFRETMESVCRREDIQGIITIREGNEWFDRLMQQTADRGIRVCLLNAMQMHGTQETAVSAGNVASDLMRLFCGSRNGNVLLLGGSRNNELHDRRVRDFTRCMEEQCPNITILSLYEYENLPKLRNTVGALMYSLECVLGIFAVSARETLCMCEAVSSQEKAGEMITIGVDAFPELEPYFKENVLSVSLYHHPARKAYLAFYQMASSLTSIPVPGFSDVIPITPVFRSDAYLYCSNEGIL